MPAGTGQAGAGVAPPVGSQTHCSTKFTTLMVGVSFGPQVGGRPWGTPSFGRWRGTDLPSI